MQMVGKSREAGLARIDVRECDQRRRRGFGVIEKQRELVDEVAQRGFTARTALIGFGGKNFPRDTKRVTEEGDLFGLGFKIGEYEVAENEIEKQQTGADELDRMTPAITEILLTDIAIESSGKKMIHAACAVVFAPGDMPAAFQLGNEVV